MLSNNVTIVPSIVLGSTSLKLTDLFYLSYQSNFSTSIDGYTNDCGWGCTIRNFQSMIGNSIQKVDRVNTDLFKNDPNAPFSIHNIVSQSKQYGYQPGNYYSPSVVAQVTTTIPCSPITFLLARDLNDKNDFDFPLVVLLPTCLGMDKIDESYIDTFKRALTCRFSLGIIGGKDSSSYYFVGITDKDKVLYLDPHYVNLSLRTNFHYPYEYTLSINEIDSSMTFCFLVSTKYELYVLIEEFTTLFDTVYAGVDKKSAVQVKEEDDFVLLV